MLLVAKQDKEALAEGEHNLQAVPRATPMEGRCQKTEPLVRAEMEEVLSTQAAVAAAVAGLAAVAGEPMKTIAVVMAAAVAVARPSQMQGMPLR